MLAGLEVELGRLADRVDGLDLHLAVESAALGDDERGEQLGRARDLPTGISVFFKEHLARARIDEQHRLGRDLRGLVRVNRSDVDRTCVLVVDDLGGNRLLAGRGVLFLGVDGGRRDGKQQTEADEQREQTERARFHEALI